MFDFDGIPDDVPDWDGDGDVDGDDYFIDTMLMVEAYRDDVRSRGARASAPPSEADTCLGYMIIGGLIMFFICLVVTLIGG